MARGSRTCARCRSTGTNSRASPRKWKALKSTTASITSTASDRRRTMMEYSAKLPTTPIPFQRLLKIVVLVDRDNREVRELIDRIEAENFEVEVSERWDERAQPTLDYFLSFEESFNRFPGFNYEVQGVHQEPVDGRIK